MPVEPEGISEKREELHKKYFGGLGAKEKELLADESNTEFNKLLQEYQLACRQAVIDSLKPYLNESQSKSVVENALKANSRKANNHLSNLSNPLRNVYSSLARFHREQENEFKTLVRARQDEIDQNADAHKAELKRLYLSRTAVTVTGALIFMLTYWVASISWIDVPLPMKMYSTAQQEKQTLVIQQTVEKALGPLTQAGMDISAYVRTLSEQLETGNKTGPSGQHPEPAPKSGPAETPPVPVLEPNTTGTANNSRYEK